MSISRFLLFKANNMKLIITWKYVIAFLAFNMIMGELHEQAHIITGYLICGCYGPRDISSWTTCADCARPSLAFWATAVGPLFSYAMMWLGASLFSRGAYMSRRAIGFSLLFANLPFARIFTALVGGGDEKTFLQQLMGEDTASLARIMAIVITMLICMPPVIMAAKKLMNKNVGLIIAGFLILPLLFGMVYQRMLINGLLREGVAADTNILGTPDLILVHFGLMLAILWMLRRELTRAFVQKVSG